MACVAVTSLMRTLELEFLQSNPRLILKDKQHIKSLHEKLGCLQKFLDESEKKAERCEELKDLIAKIREAAFKAEYDIEVEVADNDLMMTDFRLALESEHEIEAALVEIHSEMIDPTLSCVLQDVEQLMEMIRNATHLAKDQSQSVSSGGQSLPQHTSKHDEDAMVGYDKELVDVKFQLIQHLDKELHVMALTGMGGIGKTKFARKLFDDSAIKLHFDCRGWATMSQENNKRQVLLQLCHSVMPMPGDIDTDRDDELSEKLQKSLKGKRFFIIVDDIWSTEAWDDVQRCFPAESTGSRILLTTRLKKVADYACSGELDVHDMRFLDSTESWTLFHQKLMVKGHLNQEFETIGRNIVLKCNGLPLTVVVVAGHLSTNMAVDEWEYVESMLNSLVNLDLSKQFSRIFTMSYNNLPCQLKGCLLYLGAFPEDSEMKIKKIIRLWIAEGFIKEGSQMTVEELGEMYLHELINRSLIMISGWGSDGKIKTCKMHDILHDLCVSKAKSEKLLYDEYIEDEINWHDHRGSPVKMLRSYSDDLCDWRTILGFEMYTHHTRWRMWRIIPVHYNMLRVLDFTVTHYHKAFPFDAIDVVLLRYLALPSNWLLTNIPVWKNRNLQTLVVCQDINGTQELPHGIWELPQLRHLEFHHQLSIYNPQVLQLNLQTLYWLHSLQCTKQVFLMIPNVKELGIIAQGSRQHCCLDNLNCLNQLEKIKVEGTYCPIKLPRHAHSFPQNLNNITFTKTLIPWEDMSIISMLPNLEVLKLKNHACLGQLWKQEDGFPRLKFLLISVSDLKDWKADGVDGRPFPVLERLVLRNCFQLKEMPSWIDSIYTLKSIQLEHCYASFVRSARMIEEEQRQFSGEYGFQILEFHTQPDEDQKNSHREEIEEDQENSDAQSLWIEARSLNIAWVENPKYWLWIKDSGHEAVELLEVCWLDIIGTVDTKCLRKMTSYATYLVFKLKPWHHGLDTALASVKYLRDKKSNGDKNQECQVFVAKSKCSRDFGQFPDFRHDGWMEIKLGDFYVSSGNEGEVQMQLLNTKQNHWKSGLIVKGIEVRPN